MSDCYKALRLETPSIKPTETHLYFHISVFIVSGVCAVHIPELVHFPGVMSSLNSVRRMAMMSRARAACRSRGRANMESEKHTRFHGLIWKNPKQRNGGSGCGDVNTLPLVQLLPHLLQRSTPPSILPPLLPAVSTPALLQDLPPSFCPSAPTDSCPECLVLKPRVFWIPDSSPEGSLSTTPYLHPPSQ